MRRIRELTVWLVTLLAGVVTVHAQDGALKVYAAASTKEAVERIIKEFSASTGLAVEVSPGPSSKLAKQIAEGSQADIFLSADQANVDYLEGKGLVASRRNLLGNRLVVIVPADSKLKIDSLDDLAGGDVKELALAISGVPAGEYARQALQKAAVWSKVEAKVVGGEDVRATLAFVERGATAGIVYLTDTLNNAKVRVAVQIDPSLHKPIEYPIALIKKPKPTLAEATLYQYFRSEFAADVFRKAGFEVLK